MDELAGKLLELDLKERLFVVLQERCDYVWAVSGVSVSRSLLCGAIARVGSTRKKGNVSPQSETSSKKQMTLFFVMVLSMAVEDSSTAAVFEAYLESATKSP